MSEPRSAPRSSGLRRGGRLRRRSKKGARSERELAKARAVVLERAGGWCEILVDGVCGGVAGHVHHVKPRSAGGSHDPDTNLVAACPGCHAYVHAEPEWSRQNGWIR